MTSHRLVLETAAKFLASPEGLILLAFVAVVLLVERAQNERGRRSHRRPR